jgi:hypothetical protein
MIDLLVFFLSVFFGQETKSNSTPRISATDPFYQLTRAAHAKTHPSSLLHLRATTNLSSYIPKRRKTATEVAFV